MSIGTYLSRARKDQSPRRASPHPPIRGVRPPAPLAPAPRRRYTVVTVYSDYKGGDIYVRRSTSRGRGPYFQLVRPYREGGKVKQEVLVHLGRHERPEDALAVWPAEVEHLRRIGREEQAAKLEANLEKLRVLTEAEKGKG